MPESHSSPERRRAVRGAFLSTALTAAVAMTLVGSPAATAAVPEPTPSGGAVLQGFDAPNRVKDSYIVTLKEGQSVAPAADRLVRQHGGAVKHVYRTALNGFAVTMNEQAALAVAADPAVARVEADRTVKATDVQPNPPSWGLDRIDQAALLLDSSYTYAGRGENVHAYVIDTGILTTHSDFGGRAGWGTNTTGDGFDTDCAGHGTHVAGTTGGSTYGVAKGVKLVAVKVLGCDGSGSYAGVIAGVDWVTANAVKPAVANMSLGGSASSSLDDAITRSIASGVTYAVSAGNDNSDACSASPARTPSAITVGSTTSTDARSSFSNYGACVDLFAPGSAITSAWNSDNGATNTISGTSMASPHVAGDAALIASANPTWTPQEIRDAMVARATDGAVTSPGTGSPNKLLRATAAAVANDFTVKLSPSSGAVTVGGSVTSTLNTTLAKGTAQDIALTASGLPNGARATFSPASVTAGDSSAMTITTSPTTPNGTYAVRVTGTSPAISHTVTFTLTVSGGPCPDGQKLVNPGFEAGSTGWTATSGVIGQSTTQPPRSGTWNAHLDGYGKEHTDSLTQGVSLPQGCNSYTLDYWLRIDTAESSVNAWDTLKVQVLNSDGSRVLDTLKTYSNVNAASGYFQRTLDLAPYAGQDIVIRFLGTEDFALKTSFALDDITVNVS